MPRSVNHVASRAKRKRILKLTRGYYGCRKNVWTVAKNTWEKGLTYAYRDRKNKKRNFRARLSQTMPCSPHWHCFFVFFTKIRKNVNFSSRKFAYVKIKLYLCSKF